MSKNNELRTLITLVGKLDPSVQAAMLKASNESRKCSNNISKHFALLGTSIKDGVVGFAKGVGKSLLALSAAAAVAFTAMGVQGLGYASDLQEVQNVVVKTFGTSTNIIDDFAKTSLKAFGVSELDAKEYTGTLGSMLKSMGLAGDEVLTMSQNLTALSGDMASFRNMSTDGAFEKIRAGISGETEPLKQLGINMSVANLQAYALANGIKTSYGEMSQAEQALLRYNYLLDTTKDMQGDFADNEDNYANQLRMLPENLKSVSGEIMQGMMPALAKGMKELNGFLTGLDTKAIGAFVGELGNMAVAFLPMVMDLLPSFGSLLMLIVPPLMEIGQMLIPIIVELVGTLMTALAPIIPIFMDIVQTILPPIALLLQAIMPLISGLASLLGGVLSVAISQLVGWLTPLLEFLQKIGEIIGWLGGKIGGFLSDKIAPIIGAISGKSGIAGLFGAGTGKSAQAQTQSLPAYARGGFADSPSIFGEAGLEAAIPIKRGSARSIGLLHRTAQLLGIGEQYNNMNDERYHFTYAPVIQMSEPEKIEPILKRQARQMRDMLDDYFSRKERISWG